jgi:hypothetical protein
MAQTPIEFALPEVNLGGGTPADRILDVPYLQQPAKNWCWATCTRGRSLSCGFDRQGGHMTDAEKKTAVLVALVRIGIVDLDSLAHGAIKRLPTGFDVNNLSPDLGSSSGILVGRWYVLGGGEE